MHRTQAAEPVLIYDATQLEQGIQKMAQGLLDRLRPDESPADIVLLGIHGGGGILLDRVCQVLANLAGLPDANLDHAMLDISQYRDDYTRLSQMPSVRSSVIPFAVDDRHIALIDDVIFTGRTTRAALEAIFYLGRPSRVDLAVLVDRGHREFPIQPDLVGLSLETARHQSVNVYLFEEASQDCATLEDNKYIL